MTTGLVVGVLVVVGVIVARLAWRRVADERLSVREHQHTLETLRHMADSREEAQRAATGNRGR
ncbi:MAG TPA: hypothetical protein VMB72_16295, partial [Acidimicrobiales bacterium]|nr:hypothetical protein [Acidimicrobiales bacterium]